MKTHIVKLIQQRINSAMLNDKNEAANALRELLGAVLAVEPEGVSDLYKTACRRNAELMGKVCEVVQENRLLHARIAELEDEKNDWPEEVEE